MTAGRTAISKTKSWCTPPKYVAAVKEVFGGLIDLDPCSNEDSLVQATHEYIFPYQDGLKESWNFKRIYVNPPYGFDQKTGTSIKNWFERIAAAAVAGSEIIALVPVATNTSHWKLYVYPYAASLCFLYDTRLKFFINGREDPKGAPMSCCTIYYGRNTRKFASVFSKHGAVLSLDSIVFPNMHDSHLSAPYSFETARSYFNINAPSSPDNKSNDRNDMPGKHSEVYQI